MHFEEETTLFGGLSVAGRGRTHMALLAGSQNHNIATVRHCEDFILLAHVYLCMSKRRQPSLVVYQSPEGAGPIWPSWRVVRIAVQILCA